MSFRFLPSVLACVQQLNIRHSFPPPSACRSRWWWWRRRCCRCWWRDSLQMDIAAGDAKICRLLRWWMQVFIICLSLPLWPLPLLVVVEQESDPFVHLCCEVPRDWDWWVLGRDTETAIASEVGNRMAFTDELPPSHPRCHCGWVVG